MRFLLLLIILMSSALFTAPLSYDADESGDAISAEWPDAIADRGDMLLVPQHKEREGAGYHTLPSATVERLSDAQIRSALECPEFMGDRVVPPDICQSGDNAQHNRTLLSMKRHRNHNGFA